MPLNLQTLSNNSFHFAITGGAGFIGSNVVARLLCANQKVSVIDNLSTGKIENINYLEKLGQEHQVNFRFIEGDIRNSDDLNKTLKDVDFVIHLAALGSVPRSIEDPWLSHDNNVNGTLQVFMAAKNAKVKKIVYASSSSVYGNAPVIPNVEGSEGTPLSPYAITKKINELYAENFSKIYELSIVGLRYFNVFGPRQDPQSRYAAVIPKFINHFIRDEAPMINGDGTISRDFTFVSNVIEANLLACFSDPICNGKVFNVACNQTYSLNDLVAALKKISGKNIQAIYGPNRPGDIHFSQANISRAIRDLDYRPEFNFYTGLNQTYQWYLEQRSP